MGSALPAAARARGARDWEARASHPSGARACREQPARSGRRRRGRWRRVCRLQSADTSGGGCRAPVRPVIDVTPSVEVKMTSGGVP